jgi:hypothetical protein
MHCGGEVSLDSALTLIGFHPLEGYFPESKSFANHEFRLTSAGRQK